MRPVDDKRSVRFTLGRVLIELYPHAYRERYGEELRAVLQQSSVTAGTLFDLLRGALDAHLRPGALAGSPVKKMRGTVSAALALWIAVILVGAGFAKTTEDAPFRVAESAHPLLGGARIAVEVLAVAAAVVVVVAGAPLAVSIVRQAWNEKSSALRRALAAPLLALAVFAVATGALVVVAGRGHSNGSVLGHIAFVLWLGFAVAVAGVCALGARTAIERAELRAASLALAARGAWLLARVMAALTVAMALYAVLLAVYAWSLEGFANGPFRIPTSASLALLAVAMVLITTLALVTARRGTRPARAG